MTDELIIHKAPWQDWYATQDAVRGVLLCNRAGEGVVKVEPPPEWGRRWRWNVTEDGSLRLRTWTMLAVVPVHPLAASSSIVSHAPGAIGARR